MLTRGNSTSTKRRREFFLRRTTMYKRYEIQTIDSPTEGLNYRITDTRGDNRIATCYDKNHAELVCKALNYYEGRAAQEKIDKLAREASKLKQKQWRTANKERLRERSKQWRAANKENRREYNKRHYEENKERIKEQRKRDTAPAPKRSKRIKAPEGLPVQAISIKYGGNNY